MNKPLRVLHVSAGMNRGGSETFMMNLYRNVDRNKVQFDFILHTNEECAYNEEIRDLGGRIFSVPRYRGVNHFSYVRAWSAFFKEHPEYRIIHGHVRSTASIYLKIARKYGLKTIAHSHNTSSGKGIDAIVKNILQYPIRFIADYCFACSKSAGYWLFGQKRDFQVLNNSIDTAEFTFNENVRDKKREELKIQNKLVIGHVGRFHSQKNHIYLIDIFNALHAKNDNSVLLLVGDGELRASIEEKIRSLNLTNNVILTGVRSDIPELLQAMDVFVFPSLFEGLGIVVVEAQAAGLPCIVADTIPREAHVTNLIENLSLNEPPVIWAKTILRKLSYKRRDTQQEIIKCGYDIKETVKWLEEFYLTC